MLAWLPTWGQFRESRPADANVLALLAAAGQPHQLEFTTSLSFDRVEVTFDYGLLHVNALSNITTNILYAYGVTPGDPKVLTGYLSQFASPTSSHSTRPNRQEISFRTTRVFSQVGITINSTLAAATTVNVYSAFADDAGLLQIIPPPTPLPVVLTSFAVSRAAGATAAEVAWATASEQHSAYFVVGRTPDPQAGFAAIGQVAAAGPSAASHQYSLRDAAAPTRTTSYYRLLRQVDTDGTATLSPVVALAATDVVADGFALYPNPTTGGTVALSLSAPVADGTVSIYSAVGQVVRRQAMRSGEQAAPTLSTAGLPTGIYHVVLRNASGQALGTQRLVITH